MAGGDNGASDEVSTDSERCVCVWRAVDGDGDSCAVDELGFSGLLDTTMVGVTCSGIRPTDDMF